MYILSDVNATGHFLEVSILQSRGWQSNGNVETGSALVFASFIFVLYREGLPGYFLFVGFMMALLGVLALVIPSLYLIIAIAVIAGLLTLIIRRNRQNFKHPHYTATSIRIELVILQTSICVNTLIRISSLSSPTRPNIN